METGKEEIDSRKATRAEKLQIVFLILLLIAISTLIIAVVTVLKYKDMLNNPLSYNLDKFELQTCKCLNMQSKWIEINSKNYKPTEFYLNINGTK